MHNHHRSSDNTKVVSPIRDLRAPSRRFWLFSLLILAIAGLVVVDGPGVRASQDAPPQAADAAHTVRVIIDFDNGAQRVYTSLPWSKGMTAFEALKLASEHPQGFKLDSRGRGETAFITGIDGVANERGGSSPRFWRYWVNTDFATRGAGVQELQPSDVVLWRYGRGP